ncbi:MAG: GNAT family N-acetyltransferase [Prevotella sp.]|jgi:GNAT superfamily N-acetyltransferase|uniref:GNAT family N-acetyltransferase n=1 Tax=unclassified Dysgonomonas TaxID=2630389 RepID=UPI0025C59885|nr:MULTISPECIES: GNAT family N-acetyltransferase [unclassified Dysgonomonas]MDR1715197.1 GNAT family N-acetyltransferase [Prevotella sp.]HMM04720.1 GNAT family N-acetyltransferase [Dysgonomonas sp.]
MNKEHVKIYKATLNDVDNLVNLRIAFLKDELSKFSKDDEKLVREKGKLYFERHLKVDDLIGLIAEVENEIVATAFLLITEKPISPTFPNGYTGTLLNVFTYPQHRRKGFAKSLIERIMQEAKERDIALIDLISTTDGLILYKNLGFKELTYTALRLKL